MTHHRFFSLSAIAGLLSLALAHGAETAAASASKAQTEVQATDPARAQTAATETPKALEETEMKLSTALRSYTILQKEYDDFRAGTGKTLAESETRMAGLQGEIDALRQQLEKTRGDKTEKETAANALLEEIRALRAASINQGMELATLRDQNRQLLANNAQLIEENVQFRTKLALQPGLQTAHPAPLRPGTPAAQQAILLPPLSKNGTLATAMATAPAGKATEGERTHIIAEGDSLSKIARKYYGKADRWPEIFEANRTILNDPGKLPAGGALKIP